MGNAKIFFGALAPIVVTAMQFVPHGNDKQSDRELHKKTVYHFVSPVVPKISDEHCERKEEEPETIQPQDVPNDTEPSQSLTDPQIIDPLNEIADLKTVREKVDKVTDILIMGYRKAARFDKLQLQKAFNLLGLDALPDLMSYLEMDRENKDEERKEIKWQLVNGWIEGLKQNNVLDTGQLSDYVNALTISKARKAEWALILRRWSGSNQVELSDAYVSEMIDLMFHPDLEIVHEAAMYVHEWGPQWVVRYLDKFERVLMEHDIGRDILWSVADQDPKVSVIFRKYLQRPQAHLNLETEMTNFDTLWHLMRILPSTEVLPHAVVSYNGILPEILAMRSSSTSEETIEDLYTSVLVQLGHRESIDRLIRTADQELGESLTRRTTKWGRCLSSLSRSNDPQIISTYMRWLMRVTPEEQPGYASMLMGNLSGLLKDDSLAYRTGCGLGDYDRPYIRTCYDKWMSWWKKNSQRYEK